MLLSPKASVAKGALMTYLAPRLAQDAKVDLVPILKDIKQSNYKRMQPAIEGHIRAATRGKLAQDADIEDLVELLDSLGEMQEEEGNDVEIQTEPNAGIPHGLGHEGSDGDMSKVKAFLESHGVAPEILAKLDELGEDAEGEEQRKDREMWEGRASDARNALGRDETPEEEEARERKQSAQDAATRLGRDEKDDERAAREAKDKQARDARRTARDAKRAKDNDPDEGDKKARDAKKARDGVSSSQPDLVTKGAMDEAIAKAVTSAETRIRQNQISIREAEEVVRPWVGRLTMAMDAACPEDIYKAALGMLKVDVTGVHPSAYKAILNTQPKPGERQRMAADEAPKSDAAGFAKRHPYLGHIKVA